VSALGRPKRESFERQREGSAVNAAPLGWLGIVRLGLVQTALGAIVVLTTSTMNRVMVVELALPAMLPGALVALHYALQVLRPRLGHGSDIGGRRTPWIVGGMAVLAAGGIAAALSIALMQQNALAGIALATLAFLLIGIGVGASGTSLLVLLAKRVDASRRAAAATTTWVMMIGGFIVTAGVAGHFLDPYSPARLVAVTTVVAALALAVTALAVWRIEPGRTDAVQAAAPDRSATPFRQALAQVWDEPQSRRFATFIFVSMLAYSAQDLILEPFAGTVFGMTPGASTQLAGVQHGGVLLGMVTVGLLGSGRRRFGSMQSWTVVGCVASAIALLALAGAGLAGPPLALQPFVFALGLANGVFAVAAIGSMMGLVDCGRASREGVRMGLWGAAQAVAFGLGGFAGTAAADLARTVLGAPALAYSTVFALEGLLFLLATALALRVIGGARAARPAFAVAAARVASGPRI
jgi:BCD family chlorophyll transporter-like MFS transporter